jgi:hypothetical protein
MAVAGSQTASLSKGRANMQQQHQQQTRLKMSFTRKKNQKCVEITENICTQMGSR